MNEQAYIVIVLRARRSEHNGYIIRIILNFYHILIVSNTNKVNTQKHLLKCFNKVIEERVTTIYTYVHTCTK